MYKEGLSLHVGTISIVLLVSVCFGCGNQEFANQQSAVSDNQMQEETVAKIQVAATKTGSIFTSSSVTQTWDAIIPAVERRDALEMNCRPGGSIGLDADWVNPHAAFNMRPLLDGGKHAFELWFPENDFEAEWINSSYHRFSNEVPGAGTDGQNWSRYQMPVNGQGKYTVQLLADNCGWVYLDGKQVGYRGDPNANVSEEQEFTIELNGDHLVDVIIFDAGGDTGGKFRIEPVVDYVMDKLSTMDPYLVEGYGIEQGFPTKLIRDIHYASDGYLYLASVSGLIRMDGYHVDVFSSGNKSGFLSDRIAGIYELGEGALLISDFEGFVYRFKDERAIPLVDPNVGTRINTVSISELADGGFALFDEEKVYKVDHESVQVLSSSLSSYPIWNGYAHDGEFFILNTDGLYVQREGSGRYQKIEFPDSLEPDLSFNSELKPIEGHLRVVGREKSPCFDIEKNDWCPIHSFKIDDDELEIYDITKIAEEHFHISTSKGFYEQEGQQIKIDKKSQQGLNTEGYFHSIYGTVEVAYDGVWLNDSKVFTPESYIVNADVDDQGTIWVSTGLEGVFSIRRNPFQNLNQNQVTNSYSIIKDEEGTFWSGSFENGLNKWNDDGFQSFTMEKGDFVSDRIRLLAPLSDGGILVGVWGTPPYIMKDGEITHLDDFWPLFGKRTNATEGFYEESNGRWWLGTLDGLFIREQNRFITYYDNRGITLKGVDRIVPSPYTDDIFFSSSTDGVVVLRNNRFHFLTRDLPASSQHTRDIYIASPDTIWAAAYNTGLQRYILNENLGETKVTELNTDRGLDNAGYHRIIADTAGYLWISSNSGLLRVSERELNQSADISKMTASQLWFNENDGLFDREFNGGSQNTGFYDEESDRIFFTSIAGLVSFNPYELSSLDDATPKVEIQRVSTEGRMATRMTDNQFEISGDSDEVQVKYAHISLSQNLTDQLWYKTSEQQEWIKPANPGVITLRDLPAGETTLEIGFPNGNTTLAIAYLELPYHFYDHPLAKIFYLGGFIAVFVFLFLRVREQRNQPENREEEQEMIITGEQEQKEEDNKPRSLEPMKQFIEENYQDPNLNVDMICGELDMSRSKLYRLWNETYDETVLEYLSEIRMKHALKLLESTNMSITDIAIDSGFSSQSYFTKVFKKQYGVSPTEYREAS